MHGSSIQPHALSDGAALFFIPDFLPVAEADRFFLALRDTVAWEHIRIHGQPQRLGTFWMSPLPYTYSRQTRPASPIVGAAAVLRDAVEAVVFPGGEGAFNGVLLNYYERGDVRLGLHADDEPMIVPDSPIASVSLGSPRRFTLRHNVTGERHTFTLSHGSLLVMTGTTQRFWKHEVPAMKGAGPRINLTYRCCHSPA